MAYFPSDDFGKLINSTTYLAGQHTADYLRNIADLAAHICGCQHSGLSILDDAGIWSLSTRLPKPTSQKMIFYSRCWIQKK